MVNIATLQMVLGVLTGWLERREREAIAYLVEENRLLRRQVGGRRLRITDADRTPVGGSRAPGRSRNAEGDRYDRHAGHLAAAGIGG